MYAGYKGNSTIADTSGVKKQANSIASNSSNAESNDALLNDMNSFNAMNNVSYGQVRGASNGDMAKNTLNSVASGASAGSVAGPWGAAIGAVVGLGTGVAGIFSGNSKARKEKARLNGQIAAANQSAINNFANTASNINTNTNINLGRNYFAQGGHVFADGGKNDKYIDGNERYLMDYAQSKAYRNRYNDNGNNENQNVFAKGGHLFKNGNNVHVGVPSMLTARNESKPYLPTITRQTIKTGKVYNYYDNDHNKKPVKKVHTKSLVGDQVFIPLSPYQWTKDYVNSDVFKNRLASVFNYRNDANGELYNEVKHNIDNVGIFNVDMKKPDSYFINRLPSNASGAIYNHRRYDGYGNDAASFYDPVENIVINDVSKQKDKRFDNGDYYDRAIPHELGHTMDPHFDLSHAQYFSKDIFGHKYIDDGVSFDNNRHSYQQLYDAHKSNPFINFEHENYAHENYADIHALRYNLYRFGIKDIANGDVITKSDLSKYKKIISKLPVGPRNAFSRIFSVFDDVVIVNMLNKRASNNTNKQSIVKKNVFAEGGHIFKNGGKANKTNKSKNAKHVVLQTDYTKPVIDNYGRVFYPFSSGVVVDDKSSGLKPEIGKSGFVEHDVNQTLSGIKFDKNGNVVKNTYKESPSVNDDTRIPITSSPSVLPNGERRKEPYEPTDEQQYYRHGTNRDDVDFQERSMAAGLALAGIPFGGWFAAALNAPQALYTWKHRDETNGVNKFLDYASVVPGMKFTKALNLSKNPAIIRSARLAAWVTKKAHPSDIAIRSKQFAAPVAALQMVHKAGDAQNVLTYPSLVKDWFNRQLIDTRFDNYLDSPVKPLILNKFAEGGDLDYDAIKQSYNDSNTGYSKFNHSSGWIKDYMRDHMKTGLVADGSVDAATMKGIKKANMNMNMFYTANGTDGEEMSNNVDYGWVKKNNPSQLYQYENQNLPTNGDKVQQSNLGSSTSSKAAKKAAPINVSKSKFYANIQQETKANPQLNETMSIAYNYLIKKGFKPVNASAIVGCIYAESRMNPQQDNGDHCGLLQWTKFKTENNKKKFGDRYNKLIEHTKQLEGDKYKDGDENLLLNQLAFISDDLRSKDFNNDKVKLIHTLSKSQSIYDSAKAIMEIYGGDDKDKYSPTERAAYALYCLKNISTTKQDNNKDKK